MQGLFGKFVPDRSGLFHYEPDSELSDSQVYFLAKDALAHQPSAPAWFWFMGTPAPIFAEDDMRTLVKRWREWRNKLKRERGLEILVGLRLGTEE